MCDVCGHKAIGERKESSEETYLGHSLKERACDRLFMWEGDFGNEECYIDIPYAEHS